MFSLYDVRHSHNDLLDHFLLMRDSVERDDALARSKVCVASFIVIGIVACISVMFKLFVSLFIFHIIQDTSLTLLSRVSNLHLLIENEFGHNSLLLKQHVWNEIISS